MTWSAWTAVSMPTLPQAIPSTGRDAAAAGVERRQRRAVAAERDDDLAGLGSDRVRDLPRLPRDHDLADLDVVRLRPAAHLLEHAVEIARGMDDEA